MSLRIERGGDREGGQSMRPRVGSVRAQGSNPGVLGRAPTWGLWGLFQASHCARWLWPRPIVCLHPCDQLDRTCVSSELLTDWIWWGFNYMNPPGTAWH